MKNFKEFDRKCSNCKISFPATKEFFWGSKTGKYGLVKMCKKCANFRKIPFDKIRYEKMKHTPKYRFNVYKKSAKIRNFKFAISFEEFMALWQKPCYYCNTEISTIGIDRIDIENKSKLDLILIL